MLDVDCQSCSSIDHSVNFIYTHILVSYMYCKYSRFTLQAEVRFLSCMALVFFEVICIACHAQWHCRFVCTRLGHINKPTMRLTSNADNLVVNAKSHAREKPLLTGYSRLYFRLLIF